MSIQFESIPFFTPVHFENPSQKKDGFLEKVDDYFYLGGRKAVVLSHQAEIKNTAVELQNLTLSRTKQVFSNVLKIASFCTLNIPLVFLALKIILRSGYHFHIVKEIKIKPEPSYLEPEPSSMMLHRISPVPIGDVTIEEHPFSWGKHK